MPKLQLDKNLEILDKNQEFFLVLGTSHSIGECLIEEIDQRWLDEEERYLHILSEKLGIPYLLLGFGGSENWELTQMLLSFFRNNPHAKRTCKFVLGEVRLGSYLPILPTDAFSYNGPMENWRYDKKTPTWKTSSGISKNNRRLFSHITSNSMNVTSEEYAIHLSNNFWGGKEDYYPALKSFLDVYVLTHGTSWAYQSCLYEIVTMYEYCRVIGIPYCWFTMSYWKNTSNEFWYNYILDSLKEEYKDVYESNLFKDENDLMNCMGFKYFNDADTKCNCGHLDERYQPKMAEFIFEKLNTILHK